MTSAATATRSRGRSLVGDALGVVALAAVYAVVAQFSLGAASVHPVVSNIWPAAGIAVFALLRFGVRLWPGVALGAYVLNATHGISPVGALIIAAGNTLEAVAGASLLMRVARIHRALDRVRDVLALVGYAGIASTTIAATIGVAALVLTGSAAAGGAAHLWLVWWSGDAVGVLVVTPLLLTWTEPERDAPESPTRALEETLTFVTLVAGTDLLFRVSAGFVYLVFPMLTLIALRLGRRAATAAVAAVMAIATWHTVHGVGPFTEFSPLGNMFALQLFMAVLAAKSLLFAASRAEAQYAQTQLQALSRQLLAAQEEERRRVAREVHDELGQALTAIKMGLSSARTRTARRPSLETDTRLLAVNDTIDGAIDAVRRIVLRLRPGVLDNLGPVAALEWEAQEFTRQSGIPVRLALPAEEAVELDADRSTTLYRTMQEALTNVLRHANATSVAVGLHIQGGALILRITDDGRGIAENELVNPGSMGIVGMRERAMGCGGTLEVRRAAAGGTDVVLTMPYQDNGRLAS